MSIWWLIFYNTKRIDEELFVNLLSYIYSYLNLSVIILTGRSSLIER